MECVEFNELTPSVDSADQTFFVLPSTPPIQTVSSVQVQLELSPDFSYGAMP